MPTTSRAASVAALSFVSLLTLACTRTENPAPSGQAPASSGERASFSLKGSDTMVILGQRWAETYMKAHPEVAVQVTGGGSGTGIAALINGSTDVCQASRPMTEKEKGDLRAKRGTDANEIEVALDALAVYVNEKNPLQEISIPTLAQIYMGEITDWKALGAKPHAIVLYGRENNSGTYGYFKEHVLSKKDFAPSTQTLAGTSAVVSAVKGDEFGIGYGGIAYLEGVRALKVKKDDASPAIAPSLEATQDGTYPIGRHLYFYTAGKPRGAVEKFVEWTRSPKGQQVVGDVGYYPLPK